MFGAVWISKEEYLTDPAIKASRLALRAGNPHPRTRNNGNTHKPVLKFSENSILRARVALRSLLTLIKERSFAKIPIPQESFAKIPIPQDSCGLTRGTVFLRNPRRKLCCQGPRLISGTVAVEIPYDTGT
jgi:hypothetical protein